MSEPRVISIDGDEPITLAQAKLNLRAYSSTTEDSLITRLITVAREACEDWTDRSLVQKTLEVTQNSFYPTYIELPGGPVRSVESVTYVDTDGADQIASSSLYRLDVYGSVEAVILAYEQQWPDARHDTNSVRVRYTVGYPSTDSPPEEVPKTIIQAMHLLIAHYFEHREAVDEDGLAELPLGVKALLGPKRLRMGV